MDISGLSCYKMELRGVRDIRHEAQGIHMAFGMWHVA